MKIYLKFFSSLILSLAPINLWAKPKLCSELTLNQIAELNQKQSYTEQIQKDDSPWPEVIIYSWINADPKSALKIFLNFDEHKNYFPEVVESKVISHTQENNWVVDYKMSLPWPLSAENYTVQNQLKIESNSEILIWESLKTTQVKKIIGSLQFEKIKNKTCLIYSNFIIPKDIPGISILKSQTSAKANQAVLAMKKHIENNLSLK